MVYAGPLSEAHIMGMDLDTYVNVDCFCLSSPGDADDLRTISLLAFGRVNRRWLLRRYKDASRLVLEHWPQIEALAAALLDRGALDRAEAVEVIGAAPREPVQEPVQCPQGETP